MSSSELINRADEFDQQLISYQGEAIGEIVKTNDYAWVNVYDGTNAISVHLPAQFRGMIKYRGSYNYRGDELKISGIFNRACPQHGGIIDIHAQAVNIIRPGSPIRHGVEKKKVELSIFALLIAFLSVAMAVRRKR
ncbi:MAG: DNA-binding protein [Gammaproteobacteria bacterium]|nr:DNA-binding protein [Gammaproteobacteria bacterium]